MTTLRVSKVRRSCTSGEIDELQLATGVNVIVGVKDTGKTSWLNTISFVLGDTNPPEKSLGHDILEKYDSISAEIVLAGEQFTLERRWKNRGEKNKVFVNGEAHESRALSSWLMERLGIPSLRFPKGSPFSGASWPELTWRMLFRHVYREERFWSDVADKQPEKEQHACLLQFLGVAEHLYPVELGEEVELNRRLLTLNARREQFDEVVGKAAEGLLRSESLNSSLTAAGIEEEVGRIASEIASVEEERDRLVAHALGSKDSDVSDGAELETVETRLSTTRAEIISNLTLRRERESEILRRKGELTDYLQRISQELERIQRTSAAAEVLAPLSVRRCPHCDQPVGHNRSEPETCFVCLQNLPHVLGEDSAAARQRFDFEREQLNAETEELSQLLEQVNRDLIRVQAEIRELQFQLADVDTQLRPAMSLLGALVAPGAQALNTRIGQLGERSAQLVRLKEVVDQGQRLEAEIAEAEKLLEEVSQTVSHHGSALRIDDLSDIMSEGINEYLCALNAGMENRWTHGDVRFGIFQHSVGLQVGGKTWTRLGATSRAFLVLAYHYALLRLTGEVGRHYPGFAMIDFPPTLADGVTVGARENYLVEPFVLLAENNPAMQVVIAGREFRALEGVTRTELTQVWEQVASEPLDPSLTDQPGKGLPLTVSAHFHTRQTQIMMVLDQEQTRRLGSVVHDLGAAIQAGKTWKGKRVVAKWGGGEFIAKLVHHKDNGNVKFTVRKREARALWSYLHTLLQGPMPERHFAARYTSTNEDALDEFFVNVTVPEDE